MTRKGKWIEGTSADQAVSDVARRALELRLAVLWHYLPLAAQRAHENPEYVHQLRVASRRAVATVETFRDVLPPRRARWLLKKLKKVRRAAGAARDDDVLAARLESWKQQRPAVAIVLKQVRQHRRQAQAPIARIHRRLVRKGFAARLAKLLERIHWRDDERPEPAFAHAARCGLRQLLDQFEACAARDFSNLDALHALRIAGKQLRYAMELFATAFEPEFRQRLYAEVEQVQELLGAVNDHAVAQARLDDWILESQDAQLVSALSELAVAESAALEQSRQRFLQFWTPDRALAFRQRFASVLEASPPDC